jgi:succinate-semialdehyde dehydrogenase/glutarate-semialdehyde dehydrogenase
MKKLKTSFYPYSLKNIKIYEIGDPFNKETKLAGMARPDLADELEAQFKRALENGAEIIFLWKEFQKMNLNQV